MKPILTEILNALSDLAASLDAVEEALISNGGLKRDDIGNRFPIHKATVEGHLSGLRSAISALPD